jgi:hypothetical protein
MSDLLIGYVILAVAAAGLFVLTCWLARNWSRWARNWAAVGLVALLFVYIRTLWYDARLADLLPYSNLIVLGNWLPLFAAVLMGLVWWQTHGAILRRSYTSLLLVGAGTLAAVYPLLGNVPTCGNRWDQLDTCLQTTKFSCSPAAAATLLKRHGIEASEQEMAELCLTRHGTSWQGLYRGLKLKTVGTQWDVQLCRCSPADLAQYCTSPMILSVGLDGTAPADTEFTREFGWVPGVNHSVILEGFSTSGCAVIADPSQEMSREHWDAETLTALSRGQSFRLVRRLDGGRTATSALR